MKRKKSPKPKSSRPVFKTSQDILQFEEEMSFDGMSNDEKREYYEWGGEGTLEPIKPNIPDITNRYYWVKHNSFVSPDQDGLEELLEKNEIVPFSQYLKSELKKKIDSEDPNFFFSADPIIFESKGKTPPSVPYLEVFIEPMLGDDEAVHSIHSKTY